jgi:hypothetical protein
MNFLRQKGKAKLSDIELIAVGLTAKYMGIGSEYQLFRALADFSSFRIERSVYNRRKRGLFFVREGLRRKIAGFISTDTCYIVGSMPLEICKLSGNGRSSASRGTPGASPDKGYCASQKIRHYGYKLHAICNIEGVFQDFELARDSVYDIRCLKNIKDSYSNCLQFGDKAYLSFNHQSDLFSTKKIKPVTPMRKNNMIIKNNI